MIDYIKQKKEAEERVLEMLLEQSLTKKHGLLKVMNAGWMVHAIFHHTVPYKTIHEIELKDLNEYLEKHDNGHQGS